MRADELLPDQQDRGTFNGLVVRKGTVGAFLVNAKTWIDADSTPEERAVAERDIGEALPALRALGLFSILEVRDEKLRTFVEAS